MQPSHKTETELQPDKIHNAEAVDTSYGHILRFTGVFGGVQGLKLLMSAARNKLTSRLLGATGFGLLSAYTSVSDFLVSCSNFGLPLNATRETAELFENGTSRQIEHKVCLIRTWAVWTALFATLVCFLFSPLLSYFSFGRDVSHYAEMMWLAPVVVSFLIGEAECSILKGFRQLRRIAAMETIVAVAVVLLTIPFYYFWGLQGVIIGLIASSAVSCVLHLSFTVALFPYRIKPFSREIFHEGLPMIRRGIPYVLSGICSAGTVMLVFDLISRYGNIESLGNYRAGFTIMGSYAGLVFSALETDYFPRLSSVNADTGQLSATINRQVLVSLALIGPFLILLMGAMPLIIRLLYDANFMVIRPMMLSAVYYVLLRAVSLPPSYVPMARGNSLLFLLLEALSCGAMLLAMRFFYTRYGLLGSGMALSAAALFDLLLSTSVLRFVYRCRLSARTWALAFGQFLAVTAMLLACFALPASWYIPLGLLLLVGSLAFSGRILGGLGVLRRHQS